MRRLIKRSKYGLERICIVGDRYGSISCSCCRLKDDCQYEIWSKLAMYEDMEERGLVVAHGHIEWLYLRNSDGSYSTDKKPHCSECRMPVLEDDLYCSRCGAKMEGGAKYKDYP